MGLGLLINGLKFLSNPLVLLSILLAGSLTFGGCQSRRVKALKEDYAAQKAELVKIKAANVQIGKLLAEARANLAQVEAQIEADKLEIATIRAELERAQAVRAALEADKAKALKASNDARLDAERTLKTFMERYARATRDPGCQAILEAPLCR